MLRRVVFGVVLLLLVGVNGQLLLAEDTSAEAAWYPKDCGYQVGNPFGWCMEWLQHGCSTDAECYGGGGTE